MSTSDDTWLSTRNKSKLPMKSGSIKRRSSLVKPRRSLSSGISMTQNSPPPKQLFTATKQSKLSSFFNVRDTNTAEMYDDSDLPENEPTKEAFDEQTKHSATIYDESDFIGSSSITKQIDWNENSQTPTKESNQHEQKENILTLSDNNMKKLVENQAISKQGIKRLSSEADEANSKRIKMDFHNRKRTHNTNDKNTINITSNKSQDEDVITRVDADKDREDVKNKREYKLKTSRNNIDVVKANTLNGDTNESTLCKTNILAGKHVLNEESNYSLTLCDNSCDITNDNSLELESQNLQTAESVTFNLDDNTELDLDETQDIENESLELCTQFTLTH